MEVTVKRTYNLEDRTREFAMRTLHFARATVKDTATSEVIKQLMRSAGSVGANYIEANESLGRKDFQMHIRICVKEAKESAYWLNLLGPCEQESERAALEKEASELKLIFAAILRSVLSR